jgi:lysophospholipase L1-like esterase
MSLRNSVGRVAYAALAFGITCFPLHAESLLIDFGKIDGTNGNETSSPDTGGNHWNNLTGPTLANLVDTANTATAIDVQFTTSFTANGILSGGLLSPSAGLLGDFAAATATQDYYFTTGTISFKLKQLDPDKAYDLRLFGTRESTGARTTRYTATDSLGSRSVDLATSGAAIGDGGYNGNNDTIVAITGLVPDGANEISIDVTAQSGGFGYLGILEITTVDDPTAIDRWVAQDSLDSPDPGAVLFVGSSSIRRWETLTRDFADYRVLQRGFGGSQFEELNGAVNQIVLPYQPSAIVVWSGTNDLNTGETGDEIFSDFQDFIGLVHGDQPSVEIFYLGITKNPGNRGDVVKTTERLSANGQISGYIGSSGNPRLHYIDLPAFFENLSDADMNQYYVDALHLNRLGYKEWLNIVRPQLEAVVSPDKVFAANPDTLVAGGRLRFDFGPSNTEDGDHTVGIDAFGNHWNNWHPATGGVAVNAGEHLSGLVDVAGSDTGIGMIITGGFATNGKVNGGLLAPDAVLLGHFAVPTMTADYFFSSADGIVGGGSDDVPGGFMLVGLDLNQVYDLRFFGSRSTTSGSRSTEFLVIGSNSEKAVLQTSGIDIGNNGVYDGNDDHIAIVKGVRPDAFGQLFVDLTVVQGTFAYVNGFELAVGREIRFTGIQHQGSSVMLEWTASGLTGGVDVYRSTDLMDWGLPIGVNEAFGTFTDNSPPDHNGFYTLFPTGEEPN